MRLPLLVSSELCGATEVACLRLVIAALIAVPWVKDQRIRYDRDATAAVYGTIKHGDAEYSAIQRDVVYPALFTALL